MTMKAIQKLHSLGQSLWYDNIQRQLLVDGRLKAMIDRGEIRGVTSNPSIFNNAIAKSQDYDAALKPMAWAGWSAEDIFWQLAVEDIRAAADLFKPLYESTNGGDGYVSLEVDPNLAHDTSATLQAAKRLWKWVDRPNLMIKIPATLEGIPAIRSAIAAGLNVNVTLIFSLERYAAVMDAYLSGLEDRVKKGQPIEQIASVASFFVSRVDTKVDAYLQGKKQAGEIPESVATELSGKAAIANTKLAYALFEETFATKRFASLKKKGARLQRPLWASTSTKNPRFRDVMYVEELIASDTVNTLPPQTLDAFRDHGNAALTIHKSLAAYKKALAAIEGLGISMGQVTDELEAEGVKSFADAFVSLMKAIEEKSTSAQAELGSLSDGVAKRVKALGEEKLVQLIFKKDASVWTADKDGAAEVKKRLGWLQLPESSRALVSDLNKFLAECQAAGFTHALVLGMGGSSLAPEVFRLTFGVQTVNGKPSLDVTILDSTDPRQVAETEKRLPIETTLFIVSSKSGGTSEVAAMFDYFWSKAETALGKHAGEHFIAVTDPGTSLVQLAKDHNFRHIFTADPNVGGRYSALTAFGLVPASLLGVDIDRLLDNAAQMMKQCSTEFPEGRNPGLVLGAIVGETALHGKDKLSILADPEVRSFGSWLEQLVAESSGKQGKGVVPVDIEPVVSATDYGKDRLFVYLRMGGNFDVQVAKLQQAGQPALIFQLSNLYDVAAEFYRWEFATSVVCAILGVNAFDQPDVQFSKTLTKQKIEAFHKNGKLDEPKPVWQGAEGVVFGKPLAGLENAKTLREVVTLILAQAKLSDFVAINAYLPRNLRNLDALQKVRKAVLEKTRCATTLGFGPRFLHSTGQLHKGGTNEGIFLQITGDVADDMAIPTEDISFGTLERAQALGDFEALVARNRRIYRIHLTQGTLDDLVI
jgi:transaldolase / glucose-6-phosphate isomerase